MSNIETMRADLRRCGFREHQRHPRIFWNSQLVVPEGTLLVEVIAKEAFMPFAVFLATADGANLGRVRVSSVADVCHAVLAYLDNHPFALLGSAGCYERMSRFLTGTPARA
jgi:hypothetical protein